MSNIVVFTDGSSRGNPGPGGWGAVVVVEDKVVELGGGEKNTTNNRMELTAVIEALSFLSSYKLKAISHKLSVFTDSSYVVKGITTWISGWKRNDWKTKTKEDVLNRDLWETLSSVVEKVKKSGNIEWKLLPGHAGVVGNERCDEIATAYADSETPFLYNGALSSYGKDILNTNHDTEALASRSASKARSNQKAYSYLSLVDGKAMRHTTWPECEARVKGKSGVKFKKSLSAEDEQNILKDWGVSLD